MRVGIYARVSDERDQSVPWQLEECRRRAHEEAWEVVDEYVDEGISAFNSRKRRPEYERLRADVESGRVEAPLSTDFDRLLRQDKEGVWWLEAYESGRVRHLKFVDQSDINLGRADDRRQFRDRVSAAIHYSERLSEKIRRTLRGRATQGAWHGGGRRPFGYRVVGPKPFRLVPDEREAELIREAARHVLAGGSIYSIVRRWNGHDGAEPVRKDSGSPWTSADLRRVLLSEQVAGLRGGVDAEWNGILTRDEHEALRARLTDPARRRDATTDRQAQRWALAGLVRCGAVCGRTLYGQTRRRRLKSGVEVERRTYVCHAANGGCGRLAVNAPALERYVLREVLEHGPEPEPEPAEAVPSERAAELLQQMREVEARKDAIGDALSEGLDPRQAQRALRTLDEQLEPLRRELGRHVARPRGTRRYLADDDFWTRPVEQFVEEMLADEELPRTNEFLRSVVERVTVRPARRPGVRFSPERVEVVWR